MNTIVTEIESNEVMDRMNLAVVKRVERLEPIPLKDRIELVHLADCGYTTICEKGHKVGDLVVFIKYDSIVPKTELFEFMKEYKYRVKSKSFTERDEEDFVIKKIYSQGIVLPLKIVVEYLNQNGNDYEVGCVEGADLTLLLEVTKYIPPVSGPGMGNMQSKGDFPVNIVSKTDEESLANKTKALEEIQGKRVYITLKIEGSSLTSDWDEENEELQVCSRNNILVESEGNKFWQAAKKNNLAEVMEDNIDLVIQAECYGSGIQKNKLGIEGVDLAVFNISEKLTRRRFGYDEMVLWTGANNVPMVPVVMVIDEFDMTFDQLQELADSMRYANGELAEGIVIRPCEPFISKALRSDWSFKVISREYRL